MASYSVAVSTSDIARVRILAFYKNHVNQADFYKSRGY
jgi:hypothetical protein